MTPSTEEPPPEGGKATGWFRPRGGRWRAVVEAADRATAWRMMLDRIRELGSGELLVNDGQHP